MPEPTSTTTRQRPRRAARVLDTPDLIARTRAVDAALRAAGTQLPLWLAVAGKGGAGKSVLSGTLARVLARRGHRVLAVDSDPMPGMAHSLGVAEPAVTALRAAGEKPEVGAGSCAAASGRRASCATSPPRRRTACACCSSASRASTR